MRIKHMPSRLKMTCTHLLPRRRGNRANGLTECGGSTGKAERTMWLALDRRATGESFQYKRDAASVSHLAEYVQTLPKRRLCSRVVALRSGNQGEIVERVCDILLITE